MEVGFAGLGDMGQAIVPRLIAAGHTVTGWNRTKQKAEPLFKLGMRWADSPRQLAAGSDVVFSIVTDSEVVKALALGENGIISGLRKDAVYLDMSTIDPEASRAIGAEFTKAGLTMMDAPISGTTLTLGQGKASLMVGGDKAAFERDLRFENVTFAYEDAPVLSGIDVVARKGEVVALVGPSGSGKSTLVDLIPRFYEPGKGRILLDGIDTREIKLPALRALTGIVSQETVLFHDTVRNNIAYGAPNKYSQAQIEAAARAANAHEFIIELPQGYDTMLGERGTRLSGGQRQRLAIARALLSDPPILILDEATSALDTESERLVQEAVDRLLQGRTVFVIAHRLSTVTHADQIIVLDRGEIVERGTHAELLAKRGAYSRLYTLQFGEGNGDVGDAAESTPNRMAPSAG